MTKRIETKRRKNTFKMALALIGKDALAIVPSLLFSALFTTVFFVFVIKFSSAAFNSTKLTNAGFAVFAAIASVSFSWYKTLTEEETYGHEILNGGRLAFGGAIFFLMASMIKYTYQTPTALQMWGNSGILFFLNVIYKIFFFIAFFFGTLCLMNLVFAIALGLVDSLPHSQPTVPEIAEETADVPDDNSK